ncbi:MAG: hypothetical protein ABIS18_00640 [Actinomycetota bacterium]
MEFQFDGTTATYSSGQMGQMDLEELVPVSEEDWELFVTTVTRLGVWDWKSVYTPSEMILDGTSWALRLKAGKRRVVAEGTNDFPPDWETFCAAVSHLAGDRPVF